MQPQAGWQSINKQSPIYLLKTIIPTQLPQWFQGTVNAAHICIHHSIGHIRLPWLQHRLQLLLVHWLLLLLLSLLRLPLLPLLLSLLLLLLLFQKQLSYACLIRPATTQTQSGKLLVPLPPGSPERAKLQLRRLLDSSGLHHHNFATNR
jgi:hypothetical protein